jgi:hypothetical protein
MAVKVAKSDVWSVEIPDRPGGLARKLEGLADAGVDLEFVFARRQPDKPGTGVAFISGVKGAKGGKAAAAAGFAKTATMPALRVDAPNKPGLCQRVLSAVSAEGVNVRGISASVIGKACVIFLAFDSADDAAKAAKALKKL